MITTAVPEATTYLALMPDFMDPVHLLNYFGTWALAGLLLVIFVESGVLFPVLPGDSLLFVAGMLAASGAATAAADGVPQASFRLWQLLVFIPIAAILGGQVGYFIGRFIGLEMFKPDARFLKQRYLDEAHAFLHRQRLDRDVGHVEHLEQQLDHAVDAHDLLPLETGAHAVGAHQLLVRPQEEDDSLADPAHVLGQLSVV